MRQKKRMSRRAKEARRQLEAMGAIYQMVLNPRPVVEELQRQGNYWQYLMETLQGKHPLPEPDSTTANEDGSTTHTFKFDIPLE